MTKFGEKGLEDGQTVSLLLLLGMSWTVLQVKSTKLPILSQETMSRLSQGNGYDPVPKERFSEYCLHLVSVKSTAGSYALAV